MGFVSVTVDLDDDTEIGTVEIRDLRHDANARAKDRTKDCIPVHPPQCRTATGSKDVDRMATKRLENLRICQRADNIERQVTAVSHGQFHTHIVRIDGRG